MRATWKPSPAAPGRQVAARRDTGAAGTNFSVFPRHAVGVELLRSMGLTTTGTSSFLA